MLLNSSFKQEWRVYVAACLAFPSHQSCLPACLHACLPACVPACAKWLTRAPPACLPPNNGFPLRKDLTSFAPKLVLQARMEGLRCGLPCFSFPSKLPACLPACTPACLLACVPACAKWLTCAPPACPPHNGFPLRKDLTSFAPKLVLQARMEGLRCGLPCFSFPSKLPGTPACLPACLLACLPACLLLLACLRACLPCLLLALPAAVCLGCLLPACSPPACLARLLARRLLIGLPVALASDEGGPGRNQA